MSDVETAVVASERAEERAARPGARLPLKAALLLALINVLWAASVIPAKIALGESGGYEPGKLGPFTLAFARFAPAALLLCLLLRLRGRRIVVRREDRARFVVLGLGLAVTYGIFYGGVRVATATDSTLLISTEPILTALIARLLLGEQLRRVQSLGMAVGFAGAYLIVNQGAVPRLSPSVIANAVVVSALCFESFASVLGKRLAGFYPGLVVLAVEMLVGAGALLPFAAGELVMHPPGCVGGAEWASVGFLALVCSFFCYGVWFWLLPRHDVSAMAGFLFIQPMMGPVYGFLLRGERMLPWTGVGAILVIVGVWLVAVVGDRRRGSLNAPGSRT